MLACVGGWCVCVGDVCGFGAGSVARLPLTQFHSPLNNEPLAHKRLIPNHALRRLIVDWHVRIAPLGAAADAARSESSSGPSARVLQMALDERDRCGEQVSRLLPPRQAQLTRAPKTGRLLISGRKCHRIDCYDCDVPNWNVKLASLKLEPLPPTTFGS